MGVAGINTTAATIRASSIAAAVAGTGTLADSGPGPEADARHGGRREPSRAESYATRRVGSRRPPLEFRICGPFSGHPGPACRFGPARPGSFLGRSPECPVLQRAGKVHREVGVWQKAAAAAAAFLSRRGRKPAPGNGPKSLAASRSARSASAQLSDEVSRA